MMDRDRPAQGPQGEEEKPCPDCGGKGYVSSGFSIRRDAFPCHCQDTPTPKASQGEEDGNLRSENQQHHDNHSEPLTPSQQDSIGGLVERLRSDYPIEAEEETPHLVIETYKEDRQEAAAALEDLSLGIRCAKARNKQQRETIAALRSALEKIASCESVVEGDIVSIARAALLATGGSHEGND